MFLISHGLLTEIRGEYYYYLNNDISIDSYDLDHIMTFVIRRYRTLFIQEFYRSAFRLDLSVTPAGTLISRHANDGHFGVSEGNGLNASTNRGTATGGPCSRRSSATRPNRASSETTTSAGRRRRPRHGHAGSRQKTWVDAAFEAVGTIGSEAQGS